MNIKENILGIPSRERFRDEALALLADSGVQFELSRRQLGEYAELPEIGRFKVVLMKPRDTINAIESGEIALGIVGQDIVKETGSIWDGQYYKNKLRPVQELLKLGIGKARFVIAAPVELGLKTREELEEEKAKNEKVWIPMFSPFDQLQGLTIATSLPYLTRSTLGDWTLDANNSLDLSYKLYIMSGSVEVAPFAGLSDVISDLVDTGDTLKDNRLKELATIFNTEGILVTNASNTKGSDRFVDTVRDRIFATLLGRGNPDAIKKQKRYEAYIASYR